MNDWKFAQRHPSEQLCLLHTFAVQKGTPGQEREYLITVREFTTAESRPARFYAEANRQTNQRTAAFTPCGWGDSLLDALSDCVRAIDRFPYQGE